MKPANIQAGKPASIDTNRTTSDLIEELENRLQTVENPRNKVDLFNLLAVELSRRSSKNLPRAIAFGESACELSLQKDQFGGKPYLKGLAESLQNLADFYTQINHFEMSVAFLARAQSILKMLPEQNNQAVQDEMDQLEIFLTRAVAQNAIGRIFDHLNELTTALDYFNQSWQSYEKLQDAFSRGEENRIGQAPSIRSGELVELLTLQFRAAETLYNIGGIHIRKGDYNQALTYMDRSLDQARLSEELDSQARALQRLGIIHYHLENYAEALDCCLKSVELYRQTGFLRGEVEALESLGDIYVGVLDEASALDCYTASIQRAEEIDHRAAITTALMKTAEIYRRQGSFPAAVEVLERATKISEDTKAWKPLYECHRALSMIYRQMGNYEKALQHFEQFFSAHEEFRGLEVSNQLRNLEIAYQVENSRKEAEIYQLRNVTMQAEIRERSQLEQLLLFANQQLQQDVKEREQLIADLDAFSQMVAHDLKTPLTNIALSAGVLRSTLQTKPLGGKEARPLREARPPNPAAVKLQQESVDRILEMITKSNRIISELLLLAGVRKEKVEPQPLDMGQIIQDGLVRLENIIYEYQAEIRLPQSPWPRANGYAPWIEEVWANYLSNAIYYGGRPPILQLGCDDLGDHVRFWVKDNGPGISAEDQANLFVEFGRLSTTRLSGHGLGLSIVKRIVEKLGGVVGVVSERANPEQSEGLEGQGSLFFFTLPKVL